MPDGEAPEITAIRKGWEAYETALDGFYRDPSQTDYSALYPVTADPETSRVVGVIAQARELKVRQTGDAVFRSVSISVASPSPAGAQTAIVVYCADPAHLGMVNYETGESLVRSETLLANVTMELGVDNRWRAVDYTSEFVPC